MTNNHWSDCRLNDMPAYAPGPCSCGNFKRRWYSPILNVLDFIHHRILYHTGRV